MINITLIKENDVLLGFESKGHAQYADEGSDIICAGVSALTQTCLVSLVEVAGLNEKDIDYTVNKGNIKGIIRDAQKAENERVQTIFKVLEVGIKKIENEYSKYIKLKYRGCSDV